MRTLLAILLCVTCLISSVELFSMLRSNPPWTFEGHLMALWLFGVASFSGLGMYALTGTRAKERRWRNR